MVWGSVQGILNAATNLSKAFWGQGGSLDSVRQPLRASLGVKGDSPLQPTSMRNNFDHFDDRLDEWWQASKARNHLDQAVMPPGAVQGIAQADMFRVLDPSTVELVFWGDRYNLREIVQEAKRILPLAEAEAAKPHWDPPPRGSTLGGGE